MSVPVHVDDEHVGPLSQVAEVLVRLSHFFEEDSIDDDAESLDELGLDFGRGAFA